MSKLGNKELSSSLSDRHGLNKTDTERFVSAFFEVINEGLESDKLVKVKGLGTFKIIGVAARKSVDVNTGAPIVIEGRDKISFTPDATLRDEVNKPFAQFDTVVLNDGVDFSNIDQEFDKDPEAAVLKAIRKNDVSETPISEPTNEKVAEEKVAEEKVAEEKVAEEKVAEEKVAEDKVAEKKVGKVAEAEATTPVEDQPEVAEASNAEEKADVKEVPETGGPVVAEQHEGVEEKKAENKPEVEQPQYEEDDVEEHQNSTLKILVIAAVVIALGCIGGGYYLFKQIEKRDSHIELLEKQMKIVAQNQKMHTITHPQSKATQKPVDTLKTTTVPLTKAAEAVKVESEEESEEKALQAKYNRDPRIRTGAYIIIGIKKTVTVHAGQTMYGISRTHLGPGMECYVEAVNGGKRELKEGEKINIPSLKLKKKR